ncbi:MAG: DUF1565 domain-containing protein [Oscillatoriales cyanobacterium]|nr:MAG: DUF1565 domain-containing protein [Oscillatoriales cyanobacterium]
MVAVGVIAMTCGPTNPVQAATIADPLSNLEQRPTNPGRSFLRGDSSPWLVSDATARQTEPVKLYVNPRQGNDQTGNGSMDRPFQTITEALDRARPNTIVILAPGIYREASGEQFPIQLQAGVTVYGAPDQFGEGIEIVGGGWLMTPTAGEQSVTILGFDGAGLTGVTVRNPDGSAIWVAGGTPWIVGNTIADNAAHGVVAHDGTPYILNNRFDNNDGSDLEFSNRATPQLQDNQLDRRNEQSVGYFAIEPEQAITVANPSVVGPNTASAPSSSQGLSASSPVQPQPRPQTRTPNQPQAQNQRPNQSPNQTSEIVAWEGESSFPPIVTPSDSFVSRGPDRLEPTIARALPIDPDLALASDPRASSVRSLDTPNVLNVERRAIPLENASTSQGATLAGETRSNPPALPVRTSDRRLPTAPNVPTVSPVNATAASPPPATAPIITWGTSTHSATPNRNTGTASPSLAPNGGAAAPSTLLRWDALEQSTPIAPIASRELPPPIVNPGATASTRSPVNPPINPSIVIASETSSPSEISRSPVPIRASVEPLDRANLPFAYAPSNITPTWPQPRPASIPGLIPLPVPDPNPPIGEGGVLPPPPSVTANLSDMPPGVAPARSSVRYRVLVDVGGGVARVQAIAGSAFTTQVDGRDAIQAGAFSDRWRADQLVEALQADGLTAWIDEF